MRSLRLQTISTATAVVFLLCLGVPSAGLAAPGNLDPSFSGDGVALGSINGNRSSCDDSIIAVDGLQTVVRYMDEILQQTDRKYESRKRWITEVGFPSRKASDSSAPRIDPNSLTARQISPTMRGADRKKGKCEDPRPKTYRSQAFRLSKVFLRLQKFANPSDSNDPDVRSQPELQMFMVHKFFDDEVPLGDSPNGDTVDLVVSLLLRKPTDMSLRYLASSGTSTENDTPGSGPSGRSRYRR